MSSFKNFEDILNTINFDDVGDEKEEEEVEAAEEEAEVDNKEEGEVWAKEKQYFQFVNCSQ